MRLTQQVESWLTTSWVDSQVEFTHNDLSRLTRRWVHWIGASWVDPECYDYTVCSLETPKPKCWNIAQIGLIFFLDFHWMQSFPSFNSPPSSFTATSLIWEWKQCTPTNFRCFSCMEIHTDYRERKWWVMYRSVNTNKFIRMQWRFLIFWKYINLWFNHIASNHN